MQALSAFVIKRCLIIACKWHSESLYEESAHSMKKLETWASAFVPASGVDIRPLGSDEALPTYMPEDAAVHGQCSLTIACTICRCQQQAAAQKTLPELPQVGNLPHLPALNVNSFAGSAVQPVLEALPNVAPTPSVQQVGYEAAHAAVLQANAASQVKANPKYSTYIQSLRVPQPL